MLVTTWADDGLRARIEDGDDGLFAMLRLAQWFQSGERVSQPAWVVEWLPLGGEMTARALVALTGDLPADDEARHRLCEAAAAVARSGPPEEPRPFGHTATGMASGEELVNRIELISHALQAAEGRLHQAARIIEGWGGDLVAIALTECLAWLRALDEVMVQLWQQFLPEEVREDVSRRVDAFLDRPNVSAGFMDEEREERRQTGSAYRDWTIALLVDGTALPRQELTGLRWLAGKMLHFGPLPATELRHWRAGEEPRWKWRHPAEIFPAAKRKKANVEQLAYEHHLAGRDVTGSLNLVAVLIELEFSVRRWVSAKERLEPKSKSSS